MSSVASPVLTVAPCSPFPQPFLFTAWIHGSCVFLCSSCLFMCLSRAGHTVSFTAVWVMVTCPVHLLQEEALPSPTAVPLPPMPHESHCSLQISANLPIHHQLLPTPTAPFYPQHLHPVKIPKEHSSFLRFLRPILPSLACQCLWNHIPNSAQSFSFPLSFPSHLC